MTMARKGIAEFFGTFWLVFGGCGSAVLAAAFPDVGIGLLGVSAAFGLTVLTMAYTIGHISGCHLNPAVSIGLAVGGRFDPKELPVYILAQVVGAVAGAGVVAVVVSIFALWKVFGVRLSPVFLLKLAVVVAATVGAGLAWSVDGKLMALVKLSALTLLFAGGAAGLRLVTLDQIKALRRAK